jgi:lipopolysaccharide transport system ATP-binding protein
MAMRLAFSIATQVEPAVLIIDEALSVGDGYFQKKCLDRLQAFIAGGGTVLFCSHAMYYVTALCRHALWLKDGRPESFGPALEVVHAYEEHLAARQGNAAATEAALAERAVGPGRLRAVRWLDGRLAGEGEPRTFAHAAPWGVELEWDSDAPERGFQLAVGVDRNDNVQVCAFATHHEGLQPFSGGRRYRATLRVASLPIVKGELALYVFLLDESGLHVYDQAVLPAAFRVDGERYRTGMVTVAHRWDGGPQQLLEEGVPADAAVPTTAGESRGG